MLLLYAGIYTTLYCNVAYPIPHFNNKCKQSNIDTFACHLVISS